MDGTQEIACSLLIPRANSLLFAIPAVYMVQLGLAQKASVIEDVQNAVAAGKIVTISQSMIHYKGWTGTGYVLLYPKTGAGAYLIGGGLDGGAVFLGIKFGPMNQDLAAWLTGLGLGVAFGLLLTLTRLGVGMSIAILPIILFYSKFFYEDWLINESEKDCFVGGFGQGTILSAMGSLAAGLVKSLAIEESKRMVVTASIVELATAWIISDQYNGSTGSSCRGN